VIAVPEFSSLDVKPGDSLLLCCDGYLEKMDNDAIVELVFKQMQQGGENKDDPAKICQALTQASLLKVVNIGLSSSSSKTRFVVGDTG
jgi:serine/threonine protein phosphatase PrpC